MIDSTLSIISYADKIIIKANLSTETDIYTLKNSNSFDLRIKPNNSYNLSLLVDYQFIGLSFGFAPNFFSDNNDDALKGKSSFADIQFRFFIKNWVQAVYYNKIKGYYVENSGDFLENWVEGEDPYIQIPNLKNITWGMSTAYVFNPKFSIRNLFYQTEWQKRSAGSFVPTLFYNYNNSSFNFLNNSSEDKVLNFRLATNYYYTLVMHENWFVSPFISPSIGIRFVNNTSITDNVKTKNSNSHFYKQLDGGLQLGYSSKHFIFGGNFNFSASWYNDDKATNVENDKVYGIIYLGYRFNTPKKIENAYKRLIEKKKK